VLGTAVMSYLRLGVERKQRKTRVAKLKKAVGGSVNKSLRRHAKRNHAAVGGVGHMGRRSSKPKGPCPREERREPMKATLADFVGTGLQEEGGQCS
jgi:hypothetical protein